MHIHNIRARGSHIAGNGGISTGIVPMLRVFNETARYVDQGSKRNGSIAIYLEPWHADIDDFLKLKLNSGSEQERCRDLFYALWIPDLFMRRVEKDADWSLFCPAEAPGLADVWGAEFDTLYESYEASGKARKQIKARDIWHKIITSQIETGTPYLLYKDAVNAKTNQQNLGTIKSSNLCVAPETLVLTRSEGYQEIRKLHEKDKSVEIWNGDAWSKVDVMKTGENQKLITVKLSNGLALTCTPYHKFILCEGYRDKSTITNAKRVDASELKIGDKLFTNYTQGSQCPWNFSGFRTMSDDAELERKISDIITKLGSTAPDSDVTVSEIIDEGRTDDTYCFNEPLNHAGVFNGILTGNCSEICEYSDTEETAVCNLASIGLPTYVNARKQTFDFAKLHTVVHRIVRNLNRVIDINYYPTPETRRSNMRHRPIGIGIQGLADVFALLKLPWDDERARDLNQRIFEHIYYSAIEASVELASEFGTYETYNLGAGSPASHGLLQYDLWKRTPLTEMDGSLNWKELKEKMAEVGLRNSLLLAPMPTASTSQILGFTECFEPYTSNIYSRYTLSGEYIVVNKHLIKDLIARKLWNDELKNMIIARNGSIQGIDTIPADVQRLYLTAWEMKQKVLIDMASARGAFICQSQSLNLFVSEPTTSKITSMHFHAWKQGLKTGVYYLRTKAPVMAQKFTVDPELVKEAERSEVKRREKANAGAGKPMSASDEETGSGEGGGGGDTGICLMCSS
jgi:ribonucleotide reductase alpha subunit